jgi:hypothetical protein
MSIMETLFEDIKKVEAQIPVIPTGDYQVVVSSWEADEIDTQDGKREIIRINLVFQNNPGARLTDNQTPVDGQTAEYTLFLPRPEDAQVPAKFGRGTMYDLSLRKIRRFFEVCGVDMNGVGSMEEALNKCVGKTLVASVDNRTTEDGSLFDRVTKLS